MAVGKWGGVSLPKELIKEVREVVEKRTRGYTSISEFIKEAVREKLDKIKELEKIEKTVLIDVDSDVGLRR